MNIHYDRKADAMYIELGKGKSDKTREITKSILIDEDKRGKLLGIEILNVKDNIDNFDPQNIPLQLF